MLNVRLLGNFQLTHNEEAIDTINGSPRLQSLLAYLILHSNAPQPRQQIAFLFWPDSTEKQARTNLRKLLFQLRSALSDADEFLADTPQTVQWRPDAPFWLDVAEVQNLLLQLQQNAANRALLTRLSTLYTGPLLPNLYDDWIDARRQTLHAAVTQALAQLVSALEATYAYDEGIHYAQRLLQLDPLAEQTYLRLMRLRALAGDRTGALRTYHDCVATLRRELDVEPDAAIQTLARELQAGILPAGTIGQPAQKPAETSVQPQPAIRGLRPPTTPCLGRTVELQRITELLATPYCRLLTLYGPGGIGKTRLAVALAAAVQPLFGDGVAFVGLAPLATSETIAPAIANVIDLALVEGRRPETQLLAHLCDRQLLLVLDNAEHLLAEEDETLQPRETITIDQLVEQLLEVAPGLKILVTSREPLALYDEHTFAVQGLSLQPTMTSSTSSVLVGERSHSDNGRQSRQTDTLSAAEQLFYHQLARVRPELTDDTFSAADRAAIHQICQVVEGMPLALELAATQLRSTTPTALVTGLQQNLDILKVRWRGAHRRHQSMHAVIDSSVATLDEADRLALARLAIFQGSFSPASAEAVAATSLETLERLLHKSLLRHATGGQKSHPQPVQRFDLHALIRQYALELLARSPAEMAQTATRYYQHYAAFLHDGMTQWGMTQWGMTQGGVTQRDTAQWQTENKPLATIAPLSAEFANLNAVGRWLLTEGTVQQRQRYLLDLWDLYRLERRLPEIITLLNDAIVATESTAVAEGATALAQWHRMLGEAYHILGEFEASRRHFEATLHALDFPVPKGGIDLLTTLQRQGLQQVRNRLGAMKLFGRTTVVQSVAAPIESLRGAPSLLDAIEAYRQLVDISLFSGDLIRLVNGALYALNLAERAGDPSAQALTAGLMCVMASAVPGLKLAETYERLALEQMPLVQTPERQIDIAIYLSAYYAGHGKWQKLDDMLIPAITTSQSLHAYRRWGYCHAIWASTFIYRGQFAEGFQVWQTLYEQSLASDSFLFILPAWAASGMALCKVRLGDGQDAIALAEEGLRHLQGKNDAIGQARCYAAIALAHEHMGNDQSALTAADQAFALIGNQRPTNYAALEGYAWVAEVYLALWQGVVQRTERARNGRTPLLRDETGHAVTGKDLKAKAQKACKALHTYAQTFPIGQASFYLLQGHYAWLDNRPAAAFAAWEQCIEVASALEMQYELGRVHWHLAKHESDQ